MSAFCAICTDPISGPVKREPLGRGGALVAVCTDCSEERPIAHDDDRGRYQPPPENSGGALLKALNDGMKRVIGEQGLELQRVERHMLRNVAPLPMRPGFKLARYRRPSGRFAFEDAPELVANEPWRNEARYLGMTSAWVLFERPDVEGATAARNAPPFNPLLVLERYRMERMLVEEVPDVG